MKLTKEQINENLACYRQAMETGTVEGIERACSGGWSQKWSEAFDLDRLYRRKPNPTIRPWKPEEVPLGAQVRYKADPAVRVLITGAGPGGVLIDGRTEGFPDLLKFREHSIDNGKTWPPCGVEEGR